MIDEKEIGKFFEKLLENSKHFIKSEFKLELTHSDYKLISDLDWNKLCNEKNWCKNKEGKYNIEENPHMAYVRIEKDFFISTLFHELFGHGLYAEYSKVHGINKDEKKENYSNLGVFTFNEIEKVTNKPEDSFDKWQFMNNEGFACWVESILCEKNNYINLWLCKARLLKIQYEQFFKCYERFKEVEVNEGKAGVMKKLGFPGF